MLTGDELADVDGGTGTGVVAWVVRASLRLCVKTARMASEAMVCVPMGSGVHTGLKTIKKPGGGGGFEE